MGIFESLENLNVSEGCFEDIVGIIETLINETTNSMLNLPQGRLEELYKKYFPNSKVPSKERLRELSNKIDYVEDDDIDNFRDSKQGGAPKNYSYHPKSLQKQAELSPEFIPGRRLEKSRNFYASSSPLEDETDTHTPRELLDQLAQKATEKVMKKRKKLIESRMEDSPIFNACNGKYLTREESDAFTNQLEQDKKNYQKEQAKFKRQQGRKPKPIPPHQVPGQQRLF